VLFYIGPEFLEILLSRTINKPVTNMKEDDIIESDIQKERSSVRRSKDFDRSRNVSRPLQYKSIMRWTFRWILAGSDEPNHGN
jgi:hypothetical protein